ncbi:MAG: UDP-N-acetylmuramate--L-alanine ligase [Chlamydiia bacterium]|nr:UDP-N-acetylmuramate--L-alanine ligase [Chlamydiia bacterium]
MRAHIIGIGGVGMSAIAHYLLDMGYEVSGSDLSPSRHTTGLEGRGVDIRYSHQKMNVPNQAMVIYSAAVSTENPELMEASLRGLRLLSRKECIAMLAKDRKCLVVTGSHGKTSTSSLLAFVLKEVGVGCDYLLGGVSPSLGVHGSYQNSEWLVLEGDESDGTFLHTNPYGAIITSGDYDHPNYWKSPADLEEGYHQFAQLCRDKKLLLSFGDDPVLKRAVHGGRRYGFLQDNDVCVGKLPSMKLQQLGRHHLLNAAAVYSLCEEVGVDGDRVRLAIEAFGGVERRSEWLGKRCGVDLYDDYAHHPTEVDLTVRSFISHFPNRRVVVAFQPHRVSRLESLLDGFAKALNHQCELIITDLYAAGEEGEEERVLKSFIQALESERGDCVQYVPRGEIDKYMGNFLKSNDVFLTCGAGDITHVGRGLWGDEG